MKTCTLFIYGDIRYITSSFSKNGLYRATPNLACKLHFLNNFFLSTSSCYFYCTWCTYRSTGKIIMYNYRYIYSFFILCNEFRVARI